MSPGEIPMELMALDISYNMLMIMQKEGSN